MTANYLYFRSRLASSAALMIPALLLASPALAESGEAADAERPADIEVIGHPDPEGLLPDQTAPQAVSAISADFITKQAPTLNAFQLVNLLPGANVSTSDPYGLSTSSGLTLRGLGQDQIGVLMEGAPQNDIGYFYAYPSQFADAENVRQIVLAQGAASIDAPVVAAAGGMLSLSLDDPKAEMGGLVNLSLGSYDERRAFVRFDTGVLGGSGIKAFVSYSNNRADNWRGAGHDQRQHVDAKLLREWGDGNRASIAFSYNDAKTSAYPSPTLADWKAVGRNFNHDSRYSEGNTNYWRLYRAPFRNFYVAAPVHLKLSEQLTFDSSAYLQLGHGNAPYGTQLTETGNYLGTEELSQPIALPGAVDGLATVMGNWTGKQFRIGDVSKLTFQTGAHTITAGLWFDYGTDRVTQSYTSIGADGHPFDQWGYQDKAIRTADGRLLAYENARTETVTKGFFLADSVALTPRLTVDLGFKGVDVLRNGRNYLPGPQSDVRSNSFAALPRAALHYKLDDRQQLFANITTNFRTPNEFALYNSYYGGELVSAGSGNLKNEYSVSEELGYRYIGPSLSFSLTAFHYHFRNRQVATVVNSGGALVNSTINGGSQTSYGLDGEIDYRPAKGVSVYISGEYLHTRLGDDLPVGGDLLPTKGKRAVSSPEFQFALGTTYDDGRLFGSTALKYVGRQYATFMNDESIKGYATLDLSIGMHLAGLIDAQRMDLRLNAINVTNPHVLSGVYSVSSNAQDTIGRGGTLIAGSAPAYYVGSGRAFVATLSRAF
ncbi:MAG: TonB-dependent receptor [Novosphingobium pentaromativorans]|uniref:TonB-dependent receptor n=2 Tax=Novosphingobium TaxID=165696 RepID=A0A2W5QNQ3_9SPHN|nr:TonB-dependent receptor [Novosphingobium sp. TCA1]PZQ53140.1 MAG: TonB-dependent receptor [Novosphingobium pentaromativorans]